MGFYRNYNIINDIFKEIAIDLNNMITNEIGSPFRIQTNLNWYIKAFTLIKANKDKMTLMFQKEFQYEWMKTVNSLALHQDFSKEETFQRLMWCGGFENVLSHWLNTSLKEPIETIASYCYQYLPHLCSNKN